mgnify:FL=1
MNIQANLPTVLEPWMPQLYQLATLINAMLADDAAMLSIIFI